MKISTKNCNKIWEINKNVNNDLNNRVCINTFASECLPTFREKISELFCFEYTSNLTHAFCYDNFNIKI